VLGCHSRIKSPNLARELLAKAQSAKEILEKEKTTLPNLPLIFELFLVFALCGLQFCRVIAAWQA
jgi:hypothetical protein